MTYAPEGSRDCLRFRLAGSAEPAGSWGHEFVRYSSNNISYLSGEIIQEWSNLPNDDTTTPHAKQVMTLALEVAAFFMKHNAEADACDLLIEVEALEHLPALTDKITYPRVCLYILGFV